MLQRVYLRPKQSRGYPLRMIKEGWSSNAGAAQPAVSIEQLGAVSAGTVAMRS